MFIHSGYMPGDVIIHKGDDASELISVGGNLFIDAGVTVEGRIFIDPQVNLSKLESVGRVLTAWVPVSLPALASVGEFLDISADAYLPLLRIAHGVRGRLIATSRYGLWRSDDGLYYAGCHGPWTAKEAISHWGIRSDKRAKIFTAAIQSLEYSS